MSLIIQRHLVDYRAIAEVDTVLRVKREEKENWGQKVVEISAHQRPGAKVCA
jgi:hypothetical protein